MKKRAKHHTTSRDPGRWIAAGLTALALIGIGAMHAHVLMLRRGLDLLPALTQAGGIILIAAIPIGYLVYRFWFAAPRPLLNVNGAVTGTCGPVTGLDEDEWIRHDILYWPEWPEDESGIQCGAWGCGTYAGGYRVD